ncbi:MAG: aspartate carbamoyltransferase [Candidatus Methanoliparum thermophilum]|uniref:Aspartate carbamoyltransferase n=1 Tax=Methanoliparum thermophilum TaxID=2491083 RepID=A0A520KSF8_METT2|nr:MAG: aspartate carbamoyltransferase [Candidatus Methanoliparum thermophilum]
MFKNRDIISMADFSREEIDHILDVAEMVEKNPTDYNNLLNNKIMALLFFEPSTRTRMSFESAMYRFGGKCIDLGPIDASSLKKGESFTDTIKVVSRYADLMVIRHPADGVARYVSEIVDIPIINGGDGTGQHPTQTLLDLFTLKKENKLERVNIGIVGDLKYSRTVHSLVYALTLYDVEMTFIYPPSLRLPDGIIEYLVKNKIKYKECNDIEEVIEDIDVLYVTRIQQERFPDVSEYYAVSDSYKITKNLLESKAKDDLILLHPLPKKNEIEKELDETHYAKYFLQIEYGIYVRMALLGLIMGAFE